MKNKIGCPVCKKDIEFDELPIDKKNKNISVQCTNCSIGYKLEYLVNYWRINNEKISDNKTHR